MFIRQSFCLFSCQGILQMAVVCCYVGCLYVCVVCFKPRVTFLPIQLSPWLWSAKTSRWAEQRTGSLDEKSEIGLSMGANRVAQKERTFSSWGWGWEDKAPIWAHTQTRFSETKPSSSGGGISWTHLISVMPISLSFGTTDSPPPLLDTRGRCVWKGQLRYTRFSICWHFRACW